MKNISDNQQSITRGRGRPRGFDREEALARAAESFWRQGYEGTSIADLTAAMGITPQSLYAAFTSKADLYREALDWYQAHPGAMAGDTLAAEPDAITALTRLLRDSAAAFTREQRPKGCMISTALPACAPEHRGIAEHVAGLRDATITLLKRRIEKGIEDGQLLPETDAAALARFTGAIIQGMSIQALDGAPAADLAGIADHAANEIARHRRPA